MSRQQLEVLMQSEDAPGGLDSLELHDELALQVPDGAANGGDAAAHNDSKLIPTMEALDEESEVNDGDICDEKNGEVGDEGTNGRKSGEGV